MKLFVITSRIPYPLEKGDKLRVYHQLKHLANQHEIYLCALESPWQENTAEAKQKLKEFCHEVYFVKLSTIQIGLSLFKSIFTGIPFQTALFTDAIALKKVDGYIKAIHPDHIYCQLTRAAEYVRFQKHSKTLDYMDAFSMGMLRRSKTSFFFAKWLYHWEATKQKKYEHEVFNDFDSHTIITEEDRNFIAHPNNESITIVRNGVDFSCFSPQKTNEKYDLVFVGNMGYAPNIDAAEYLCNSILPHLKKIMPQIKILLAGAEPSSRVLNLQSDNVFVSGWMQDIREAYSSATLFIAPMRIGTGLQNKLLEAMAMKKACITTPIVNKALMAPSSSILIGLTAEELAKHCLLLLNDEAMRSQIAHSGHVFVNEHYQWSKTTTILNELLTHTTP